MRSKTGNRSGNSPRSVHSMRCRAVIRSLGSLRIAHLLFKPWATTRVAPTTGHKKRSLYPAPGLYRRVQLTKGRAQEELTALGVGDDLAAWRAMAAETRPLVAQG